MKSRIVKLSVSLFVSIFYLSSAIAQEGTPYITNFKESKEIETQNWAISQDEENVMLFANRRGIIAYDGQNWELVKIPYIPFALKKNPIDNKVYVGANNNYGYLERDSKGFIKYVSLSSDTCDLGLITKIIFRDSTIFFYGDETISRHSLKDITKFTRWEAKTGKHYTGMFTTHKNTFFNVSGKGLYRLESDTLFPIVTGFYTENCEILFSLPYSKSRVLVGTDDNKLYTFDGIKYYNYAINDEGYLKESVLADGQIISDSLYAFGTLYGGVEIVNKKTGKIVYTVNYQNGLPDDEIYSLGLDNNNGLWITHEFGVSRVDFNIPIRDYSTYPGLKGNLISSVIHNNELYVATNEGVFYLSEVKDFNEIEVWIKTRPKLLRTKVSPIAKSDEDETETKKKSKKLFSRLFSKDKPEKIEPKEETTSPKKIVKKSKTRYVKKTVSKLKSINYIYKKIEGLNDKCNQIVSTEHGVLVGSNIGLYCIEKYKVTKIIDCEYIHQISMNTYLGKYLIATNNGIFTIKYDNGKWESENMNADFNKPAYTINVINNSELWIGSDDIVYKFSVDSLGSLSNKKKYAIKTDFSEKFKLDYVNDTLFVFLENGLFYYVPETKSFDIYSKSNFFTQSGYRFLIDQPSILWLKSKNSWECLNSNKEWTEQEVDFLKLFDNISSIISDSNNNLWIINNNNQIFKINHIQIDKPDYNFNVYFNRINNDKGLNFDLSDLTFDSENKTIYINIIAPHYIKQNSTKYQYYVEGLMNDWAKWTANQDINLNVKSGNYILFIRAKNIWGNVSEIKSLEFQIKPPFTESIWFYVLIGLVVIGIFTLIAKIRERKLINDKKILEQKVKERTIEIQEKAEEIETQRDEIIVQKEEITDSINYASKIQKAALPLKDHFEKAFSDYFILYKPRDIVSGDFYWIAEDENKIYFTAADCTGHGVPGAFMSMLGISSLNEIFGNENEDLTASRILVLLREKIKFSLHQTGKEGENKDGMDMALCVLHKNKNIIEYAGAYNPLCLVRNNEMIQYKADRMPIGIYYKEKNDFENHEIKIQKDDTIYIFSDGYADQFGGPKESKFKSKNLKKLLLEISTKPMAEQKQILDKQFSNWKGDLDQIDDVIILGVKL